MLSGSTRPVAIAGALLFAALGTAEAAYKEITVKNGGVIRGTVTVGKPPTGTKAAGGDGCPAEVPDESIQGKPGRLASAVVYLKKIKKGKAWTAAQTLAVSDQRGCEYKPHVTLVAEGGKVRFLNSDTVLHNVSSSSVKNPQFNQGVGAGSYLEQGFNKGHEVIGLKCSVHPFMSGFVIVMSHPYYAVTNADGQFVLSNVPEGKYNLMVWHPSLSDGEATIGSESSKVSGGKIKDKIEVGAGGDVIVNIGFADGSLSGLTPPSVEGLATPAPTPAPSPEKPAPPPEKPSKPEPKKPAKPKPEKPVKPKPEKASKPAPAPAPTPAPAPAPTPAPAPSAATITVLPPAAPAHAAPVKDGQGVVALPDNTRRIELLILIAVLGAFLAPFYGALGVHESPLLEKIKAKLAG